MRKKGNKREKKGLEFIQLPRWLFKLFSEWRRFDSKNYANFCLSNFIKNSLRFALTAFVANGENDNQKPLGSVQVELIKEILIAILTVKFQIKMQNIFGS